MSFVSIAGTASTLRPNLLDIVTVLHTFPRRRHSLPWSLSSWPWSLNSVSSMATAGFKQILRWLKWHKLHMKYTIAAFDWPGIHGEPIAYSISAFSIFGLSFCHTWHVKSQFWPAKLLDSTVCFREKAPRLQQTVPVLRIRLRIYGHLALLAVTNPILVRDDSISDTVSCDCKKPVILLFRLKDFSTRFI